MSAKEKRDMKSRWTRLGVAAVVLPAAIPITMALAQTQGPAQPAGRSPEVQARLQDGRIAMIKEALRLDATQLKLWAPVEAQLRASFDARQVARAERVERRAARAGTERPALPDSLDRMSKRLTERAERAKALAEAMRPFYAALTDEQKAVANVVMRQAMGGPAGRRGFMRHASGADRR
jgi:hypothetical protein